MYALPKVVGYPGIDLNVMKELKKVQVFREFTFSLFVSRSPLAHISPPCHILLQ